MNRRLSSRINRISSSGMIHWSLSRFGLILFLFTLIFFPPFLRAPWRASAGPIPTNDSDQLYPRFQPMTVIEYNNTTPWFGDAAIAVDGRNNSHTAWTVVPHSPGDQSFIRYANDRWETRAKNGWSAPVTIATAGATNPVVGDLSIAATENGKIYVAWTQKTYCLPYTLEGNKDIYYTVYDPAQGTWAAPTRLTSGSYSYDQDNILLTEESYYDPKIAVDSNGKAHLVCIHWEYIRDPLVEKREMCYAFDWGALSPIPVTTGSRYYGPMSYNIAIDAGNNPHVAWIFDIDPGYGVQGEALYQWKATTGWQPEIVVSAPDTLYIDIALDSQNNTHFAYFDSNGVQYKLYSGGALLAAESPFDFPPAIPSASHLHIGLKGNQPQIVCTATLGLESSGFVYASKVGGLWYSQNPVEDIQFYQLTYPSTFDVATDKNGTMRLVGQAWGDIFSSRMVEPNLGSQDSYATFGMGPNTSANVANGNMMTVLPVFSSNGVGFATNLSLLYNSLDPDSGVISQGWQYNYQMTLTDHNAQQQLPSGEKEISLKFGDGHSIVFYDDPFFGYAVAQYEYGEFARIERNVPNPNEYRMITKSGLKYTFNATGKLREIRDTNNNTVTLTYANGLVTTITDSAGRPTTLAYNADKQLETVTDPAGKTYTLSYNTSKKIAKLAFNAIPGIDWEMDHYVNDNFDYGERGNLLKTIMTPSNNATQFAYQPDNRLFKSTDPAVEEYIDESGQPQQNVSLQRLIAYNDLDNKAVFTNRRGKTTTVEYKVRYSLAKKITDHLNNYIARDFDVDRSLLSFRDKRGNTTTYDYETGFPSYVANLWHVYKPGVATPMTYTYTQDGLNRVQTISDFKGNLIENLYDAAGNLAQVTYPSADITIDSADPVTRQSHEYYNYDAKGRVITHVSPNNGTTTYEYNHPSGLVTSIIRSGIAGSKGYTYDVMGNTDEYTDASGSMTKYVLDGLYRTTDVTIAWGTSEAITTSYVFDADSNTTAVADPNKTTNYGCNALGRRTRITNTQQPGKDITYAFDAEGNVRKAKDFKGNQTTMLYDELNRVKEDRQPGPPEIVTTYAYDPNGNVLTATRGARTTSYSYNERNNVGSTVQPQANIVDYAYYDENDNAIGTVRRDGGVFVSGSKATFDARNRTTTVRQLTGDPGLDFSGPFNGPETLYGFDDGGNRTRVTDPKGHKAYFLYDAHDRQTDTKDAYGVIVSRAVYDGNNRMTEQYIQNPNGAGLVRSQRIEYNYRGQVAKVFDAQENYSENIYYADGSLWKAIDAEKNTVEFHYNGLSQMDWKKEYLSSDLLSFVITQFTYDDNGNVKTVLDPRLKLYTYEYDASNRLIAIDYPIPGHTESWTYNSSGELLTHTDPNLKTATYTFDGIGRLTSEAHGAPYNVTVARVYDDKNHRVTIGDNYIGKTITADALARVQNVDWTIGGVPWKSVGYSYDAAGNRESMTAEGATYTYTHDDNDQLYTVSYNGVEQVRYERDSGGREVKATLANGTATRRTYDIKERMTDIKSIRSTGEVVSSYTYAYDKRDLRTGMRINHEGAVVGYKNDGLSRLKSEVWTVGTNVTVPNQYTSQPQGNESGFSNTAKATPNGGLLNGHYVAYYEYDPAGNRTIKRTLSGTTTYLCDDENFLTDEFPSSNVPLNAVAQTTQENWHEVDFGVSKTVSRVDLTLTGTSNRFKLQGYNGVAYEDISAVEVAGANRDDDGWYTPVTVNASYLFADVAASKIRYWQEFGQAQGVAMAGNEPQAQTPVHHERDNNGNETRRTTGPTIEDFGYNQDGKMTSYDNGVMALIFTIAPSGERVAKTNGVTGDSQWYLLDGLQILTDYDLPNGGTYRPSANYVNNSLDIIARYPYPSTAGKFYLTDGFGSIQRLIDENQNFLDTYYFNMTGEKVYSQESASNRFTFKQLSDDGMGALFGPDGRAYDPKTGHYLTKNPSMFRRYMNQYTSTYDQPFKGYARGNSAEEQVLVERLKILHNLPIERVKESILAAVLYEALGKPLAKPTLPFSPVAMEHFQKSGRMPLSRVYETTVPADVVGADVLLNLLGSTYHGINALEERLDKIPTQLYFARANDAGISQSGALALYIFSNAIPGVSNARYALKGEDYSQIDINISSGRRFLYGGLALGEVFLTALPFAGKGGGATLGAMSAEERAAIESQILQKLAQNGQAVVFKGQVSTKFMADLTNATEKEFGLFRMESGERLLTVGGSKSIGVPQGTIRVIAHTHPSGTLEFSIDDIWALQELGQRSSVIISPAGKAARVKVP